VKTLFAAALRLAACALRAQDLTSNPSCLRGIGVPDISEFVGVQEHYPIRSVQRTPIVQKNVGFALRFRERRLETWHYSDIVQGFFRVHVRLRVVRQMKQIVYSFGSPKAVP